MTRTEIAMWRLKLTALFICPEPSVGGDSSWPVFSYSESTQDVNKTGLAHGGHWSYAERGKLEKDKTHREGRQLHCIDRRRRDLGSFLRNEFAQLLQPYSAIQERSKYRKTTLSLKNTSFKEYVNIILEGFFLFGKL